MVTRQALRFLLGLTCLRAAQKQASETKVLQEKVTSMMEAEGLLRRELEAEATHAKVLLMTSNTRAYTPALVLLPRKGEH